MINTVVFDIGKVLVDWHPVLTGVFDKETAEAVTEAIWGSGLWAEFDLGVIADDEIWERIEAYDPKHQKEIRYVREHQEILGDPFPYAEEWVLDLKAKGYGVYYLSNYGKCLMDACPHFLTFLKYVDGGVFSCDVKMVKPDERIYRLLMDKYGLNPENCLFIDDVEANVEGARKIGMSSICFKGYEQTYEEIMTFLEKNR